MDGMLHYLTLHSLQLHNYSSERKGLNWLKERNEVNLQKYCEQTNKQNNYFNVVTM